MESGFLILVLGNSISEAVLKCWWSDHKPNYCQGELYFLEPLRVAISLQLKDHIY